jgi:uncharacterized membrane protein
MKLIYTYLLTLPILTCIDLTWLGFIARGVYKQYLGPLMKTSPSWPAIIAFYVLYAAGVLYFAIVPSARANSWHLALMNGAFLGFIVYMTYDLTNLSVLKGYAWQIVPIDIIWGTLLTAVVAVIGFFIARAVGFN